jgi:hypothetical protein
MLKFPIEGFRLLYLSAEIHRPGLQASHRVDRVPGFLSSRPNWVRLPPHLQASVVPPLVPGGGGVHTRLRERGVRGPNSDEGTGIEKSLYEAGKRVLFNHSALCHPSALNV